MDKNLAESEPGKKEKERVPSSDNPQCELVECCLQSCRTGWLSATTVHMGHHLRRDRCSRLHYHKYGTVGTVPTCGSKKYV